MREVLLDDILAEFRKVEPIELPENVLAYFAHPDKVAETPYHMAGELFRDMYHEERFGYLNISWGEWQIVIGYGDQNSSVMWNGILAWSITKDYNTYPTYFDGEITNGSPDFVVWSLFAQLSEQIEKLGASNA